MVVGNYGKLRCSLPFIKPEEVSSTSHECRNQHRDFVALANLKRQCCQG